MGRSLLHASAVVSSRFSSLAVVRCSLLCVVFCVLCLGEGGGGEASPGETEVQEAKCFVAGGREAGS